jgi:hypothetical protein
MPAELLDLQSRPAGCTLEELADGIGVQAAPRNMTVSSNRPEDRAFSNPGPVKPLAQSPDRARILTGTKGQANFLFGALLVCLRFGDVDDDTVGGELQVIYMDTGQLRAVESSRESGQNQSCVSKAQKVLTPGGDDPADVC